MVISDITIENSEDYHNRSKCGDVMSSHMFGTFCDNPVLYKKSIDGLLEEKDSSAYKFGRATHSFILEGEEVFDQDYMVLDVMNEKTGKPYGLTTKKYKDAEEEHGVPLLSTVDYDLIKKLNHSVKNHPELQGCFHDEAIPEAVYRVEIEGVMCQIRCDLIDVKNGILYDLKTTKGLSSFEYDCRKYSYIRQLGFYNMVLQAVDPEATVTSYLIAVETVEPYQCGVWMVSKDVLERSIAMCKATLRIYKECRDSGVYGNKYSTMRVLGE